MEEMKTAVNEEQAKTEAPKDAAKAKKAKKNDEVAELTKKLEQKTAECAECNDRYMRMMAEYDNFRKRSAKEKEGVWTDAYSDCIAHLLPILDNLERASKSDNYEAVAKGLEMTVKAFDDAMEKMGVKEIECKTFDPNLHNAVMHVEDENFGENTVAEVFQKGFKRNDKVIRYAIVKVAN